MTKANNFYIKSRCDRDSNFELLRIILMLLIIAHHMVVNSGVVDAFDYNEYFLNTVYLKSIAMWGKTAINIFVLISGYYLCKTEWKWKRLLRLWLEVKFYRITFWFLFILVGYEGFSGKGLIRVLFGNIYGVEKGFTSSFLVFYLFIPFLNRIINSFKQNELLQLIRCMLVFYIIPSTFFQNEKTFLHVGWYTTLYFVAAYIRIYPNEWMNNLKVNITLLLLMIGLSFLSVICIDIGNVIGETSLPSYFFLEDSNKLLAFLIGLFGFLCFKNINVATNKVINTIATTTFGVLLIHADSNSMRKLLWSDLFNIKELYKQSTMELVVFTLLIVMGVFIICSIIDLLRLYIVEIPLMKFVGKVEEYISDRRR